MGLERHVKGTAKKQAAEFYQATESERSIPKKKKRKRMRGVTDAEGEESFK